MNKEKKNMTSIYKFASANMIGLSSDTILCATLSILQNVISMVLNPEQEKVLMLNRDDVIINLIIIRIQINKMNL